MFTLVGIGLLACTSTFLGGLFALHFKDKLHLIAGFSAGAVIGVALFDLLPEAVEMLHGNTTLASLMIGIGFVAYLVLERSIAIHSHWEECQNARHKGVLGAASLSFHSFLDGVIIGVAFQVSPLVGTVVTVAVLTHDFSDGINTVTIVLRSGENRQAMRWLIVDAVAPALGILSTALYAIPEKILGPTLGVFCGCFLYIGASDLLPESHHAHPKFLTTVMTFLGMALLYFVVQSAKDGSLF